MSKKRIDLRNLFYTKEEVDLKTEVDDTLSSTSTKPLQNKSVFTALSTKIDTAGTGLSKSGTTLNHSNSVSAKTSSSLYKFKHDATGHITESTAVGIDTTSGGTSGSSNLITSGAVYSGLSGKASATHSHTKSEITDFPTVPTASTSQPKTNHYKSNGVVGTSTDYARADHQHSPFLSNTDGGDSTAGYIKILEINVTASWQDRPITFALQRRAKQTPTYVSIKLSNVNINTTNYTIDKFVMWGDNTTDLYLRQTATNTWNLIAYKNANDSYNVVNLFGGNGSVQITPLNGMYGTSKPTSTTENPVYTATYIAGATPFGTSANTVCEGNDSRLSDTRNPLMTKIPNNSDLNNYTTAGFYYNNNNTEAETIANRPSYGVKAFYLQVETWNSTNSVKQTISSYHHQPPAPLMYVRTKNGANTWSDWRQISTYNEPKFIDNETTLTGTGSGNDTLRLADGYFFQNKNNDWAIMGEIKVTGPAARFEVQVPTNTDANNLIAIGKNTSGNYSTWWSTSASAETGHNDANVTFNNDTWYPFSMLKRGNTVTFNFNNTKGHAQLPSYMNGHTYLTPQLRAWTTSNVSIRNLKIIPHIIDPLQDVTTNIDFNDYKKEGKYLIWSARQTGNTNAPDTQGGLLEVEVIPNGVRQKLTQYYVDNPKIFYRIFHNSAGWRAWKEVAVTSDVVAKSDVVNNLTSTSTTAPLAANQGKVLKDSLTWKTVSLTNMSGISLQYNDLFCRLIVDSDYSINTANAYKNLVTGTIPADYRPNLEITGLNNGSVLIRVKVTKDGNVQYCSAQTFSSNAGIHTELIWGRD